jgi:polyhydroxybutyrate depolymerase
VALAAILAGCADGDEQDLGARPPAPTTAPPAVATPDVPAPSAGCEAGARTPAGTTDATLASGGEQRRYQLIVPPSYDGTTPAPLLLLLHSLTVDYRLAAFPTGVAATAPGQDAVVVVPSGLVDDTTPYWLAVPTADNHDLDFLEALLDHLEGELCLDTARVVSTGLSNGGQMSSLLACRLGDRITAIVPIAGVEFPGDCGRPVPVHAFHGTDDEVVTYEGGGLNAARIAEIHHFRGDLPAGVPVHEGVDPAMEAWAAHNGCDPEPEERRRSADVVERTWSGCEAPTSIQVVEGGGHTWPGRSVPGFEDMLGYTTMDVDATEVVFDIVAAGP